MNLGSYCIPAILLLENTHQLYRNFHSHKLKILRGITAMKVV